MNFACQTVNRRPAVVVGKESSSAYYMGIIDFLQGWSGGKKVAHVIKVTIQFRAWIFSVSER